MMIYTRPWAGPPLDMSDQHRPDPRITESWAPSRQDDRPSSSYRRSPLRDARPRSEHRRSREGASGSPEPGQISSFTTYSERTRQNPGAGRAGLPPRPGSYRDDRRRSPPPHLQGHSARSPKSPYGRSRDSRSGSPPVRKPTYDRRPSRDEKGKGKETSFDAMDRFTQAMHATLLSTTAHTLAGSQLSRLDSFSNLTPSHPAIAEARKNLVVAEEALWEHQVQVQQAFAELIRQTGGISADLVDMDEIRARLGRLEGQNAGRAPHQPPPPAEAPPPPPEPKDVEMADPPDEEHKPGQPIKVKDAIRNIFKRLASVEAAKLDMEDKCEDLEGLIWSQAEERVERRITWEQLERDRRAIREMGTPEPMAEADPSRSTGQPAVSAVAGASGSTTEPSAPIASIDSGSGLGGSSSAEAPKPARIITLSVSPEPDIEPIPTPTSSVKGREVDRGPPMDPAAAAKIEHLEHDLQRLRGIVEQIQNNNEQRERVIVSAAVQVMRSEYTDVVKRELQKVAASYEKRNPDAKANGVGSSPMTGVNGSPVVQQGPTQNGSSTSVPQNTQASVQLSNSSSLAPHPPPPRSSPGQPQVGFPSVHTQNIVNPSMRQQLSPQHAQQRLSPQSVPQQVALDMARHVQLQRLNSQGMVPPAAQTHYPAVNPYGQPIQNGGHRPPDRPESQTANSASPFQQNMELQRSNSVPNPYTGPQGVPAQAFNGQTAMVPVGNQGQMAAVTRIAADQWAVVIDGITRVVGAEDLNKWTGQ